MGTVKRLANSGARDIRPGPRAAEARTRVERCGACAACGQCSLRPAVRRPPRAPAAGKTVTCLPPCHWIIVIAARVFWNLSSNLTPTPDGYVLSGLSIFAAAARTFSTSVDPAASIASSRIFIPVIGGEALWRDRITVVSLAVLSQERGCAGPVLLGDIGSGIGRHEDAFEELGAERVERLARVARCRRAGSPVGLKPCSRAVLSSRLMSGT